MPCQSLLVGGAHNFSLFLINQNFCLDIFPLHKHQQPEVRRIMYMCSTSKCGTLITQSKRHEPIAV